MTPVFHPPAPRLRRLLALATGGRVARGYLAVCAASALATSLLPDSGFIPDPLMLTAPLSFLGVVSPYGPGTEVGGAVDVLGLCLWAVWLLVCALVNAAVLGALVARSAAAAPTGAAPSRPRRVRALLAPAVDNWPARGYLVLVAAALVFFLYAVYLSPDPGFAGIWPMMATAPLGILAIMAAAPVEHALPGGLSPLVFSAGVVLAGLVNAALIGLLARRLRTRAPHPAV